MSGSFRRMRGTNSTPDLHSGVGHKFQGGAQVLDRHLDNLINNNNMFRPPSSQGSRPSSNASGRSGRMAQTPFASGYNMPAAGNRLAPAHNPAPAPAPAPSPSPQLTPQKPQSRSTTRGSSSWKAMAWPEKRKTKDA
eukprot:gnl/MRDRNA2_/MRDRNA2_93579_c0_seq1.p1 gnl/MRDRNA2_/MRDRNA2_93579_c0~~gnl/MRDRNA2_/MRDRNA2_93579_c0_seq1.p1  ORF type:complete len:137 (-),score=26.83 gnl/MRDRNA2_/MRDRNA2_93579_c0_seq1:100-510(-)